MFEINPRSRVLKFQHKLLIVHLLHGHGPHSRCRTLCDNCDLHYLQNPDYISRYTAREDEGRISNLVQDTLIRKQMLA